ncbi:S-formylglutathione hydrolase [Candidatus Nitrosacidococcus sp. I8]|nr:S-formylglutathione hydrolase [Candidatus Nitrosacidococcus sp. I8]
MIKAGAQRLAAEYGIILVSTDTSPRQTGIIGETDSWDLGAGAGFYLDAIQNPWSQHFKMESYITQELYALVLKEFPVDSNKVGIWGHSIGGHGALKHPKLYCSVSAFSPLAAPIYSSLGQKAFSHYLGENRQLWRRYDATALIEDGYRMPEPLIDQGLNDEFLSELCPDRLETACKVVNQPLTLRYHKNYDHGYYFVSTFIIDHMKHHLDIFSNR